jgi:RND family efflux transporter MFP subunit
MKRSTFVAIIMIAVVAVGMFAMGKIRSKKKITQTTAQIQQEVGVPVQTALVEVGSIASTIPVTGGINALDSVTLSPKIAGKVASVTVREGDTVRRGQVIVQIDPSDAIDNVRQAQAGLQAANARLSQARTSVGVTEVQSGAAIQQAKAGLTAAEANYEKVKSGARTQERMMAENQVSTAKATLGNAQANLKRYKQLFTQGAIAASQLDTFQTQYDIALAQYNSAKANLSMVQEGARTQDVQSALQAVNQAKDALVSAKANASQTSLRKEDVKSAQAGIAQAQAQVRLAQEQLANTSVRSSVDGIVAKRMVDPGQSVAPTQPLATLVDVKTVYFEAQVSETVLSQVRPGQTVDVKVDAYPKNTFIGKVAKINPMAATDTRNFGVRIHIPNVDGKLRPGMFARGSVITGGANGAVLVPQDAVEDRNGVEIVFTINKDEKGKTRVKKHAIIKGLTNTQFVELTPPSDIRVGDTVVTSGHESLDDNTLVLVKG